MHLPFNLVEGLAWRPGSTSIVNATPGPELLWADLPVGSEHTGWDPCLPATVSRVFGGELLAFWPLGSCIFAESQVACGFLVAAIVQREAVPRPQHVTRASLSSVPFPPVWRGLRTAGPISVGGRHTAGLRARLVLLTEGEVGPQLTGRGFRLQGPGC